MMTHSLYLLDAEHVMTLPEFLAINELDPETIEALRALEPGEIYQGGGGAGGEWSLAKLYAQVSL